MSYCIAQGTLLNGMWQPGWEGSLGENRYMHIYSWASNFGKLSRGHRTEKDQFSFQSQRNAMTKNSRTTAQMHSFHMLAKKCSKFSRLGFKVCELRTSRCSSWI